MAYGTRGDRGGGGHTENMLDDNVLGSVDNQENEQAPATDTPADGVDVRRRRRRGGEEHHVQVHREQQQQKVGRRLDFCFGIFLDMIFI